MHYSKTLRHPALTAIVGLAAAGWLVACGGAASSADGSELNEQAGISGPAAPNGQTAGATPPPAGSAAGLPVTPGAAPAPAQDAASAGESVAGTATPSALTPEVVAEPEAAAPTDADEAEPEAEPPTTEPADYSTNPYVSVAHDPLSTFAADVDTASYDIFRRDVERGYLPGPATVRLEEFINYFDYDYPEPAEDSEHPFAIDLAAAPTLLENGTTLLRVGIQGAPPPAFEKKPANLVFLIDTSGSMQSAEKLPLVQRVLTRTLDELDPEDTVSIVTYAGGTGVALEPTPVSDSATISGVINSLSASGSTAGASGIQLAYDQASSAYLEGGINHVILCTDGDFNVGVSSTDGLVALIEDERRSGITFTALGFGGNNNDAMMEAISNAGNGIYGVISSQDQADRYVEERLLDNLTFIAKDMKIQVEFNSELVLAYRLLGYENRAIADQDFRDDKVDAGEIGAGHRVTALYELVLADGTVPEADGAPAMQTGDAYDGEVEVDAADLVLVKVRYKDVDASALDEAYETSSSLAPEDVAASHRDLDEDFQWAVAIATFAELLKASPYANDSSLGSIRVIAEEQASRDEDRTEFLTLFNLAESMMSGIVR